jgi:signal transduction histidine kinase
MVEIARGVASTYAAEAAAKGVKLRLSAPEHPVRVMGDGSMLRQTLENLVSNAVKYTPAPGTVEFDVSVDGEWAMLAVCDTGIGIPAADQPRLFEEFFRASNARESESPGTGLGLALVAEAVKRHAGTIDVESVEGHGSRFTVRLPRAGH